MDYFQSQLQWIQIQVINEQEGLEASGCLSDSLQSVVSTISHLEGDFDVHVCVSSEGSCVTL